MLKYYIVWQIALIRAHWCNITFFLKKFKNSKIKKIESPKLKTKKLKFNPSDFCFTWVLNRNLLQVCIVHKILLDLKVPWETNLYVLSFSVIWVLHNMLCGGRRKFAVEHVFIRFVLHLHTTWCWTGSKIVLHIYLLIPKKALI